MPHTYVTHSQNYKRDERFLPAVGAHASVVIGNVPCRARQRQRRSTLL